MLSWLTGRRCPSGAVVMTVLGWLSARGTSWSGTGGQPGSVFLLGYHGVEPGLQAISHGRHGVLSAKEGDGALKLAALVGQFVGSQGMQRMFGLFDGSWISRHGRFILKAFGDGNLAP
jgi:hypothetical protein